MALSVGHDKKATRERPCGFFTDPQKECNCTPLQIQRYRSKVSGPLLDRIDIQVEVPALRYQELAARESGETSANIRQRINAARKIHLAKSHARSRIWRPPSKSNLRKFPRPSNTGVW